MPRRRIKSLTSGAQSSSSKDLLNSSCRRMKSSMAPDVSCKFFVIHDTADNARSLSADQPTADGLHLPFETGNPGPARPLERAVEVWALGQLPLNSLDERRMQSLSAPSWRSNEQQPRRRPRRRAAIRGRSRTGPRGPVPGCRQLPDGAAHRGSSSDALSHWLSQAGEPGWTRTDRNAGRYRPDLQGRIEADGLGRGGSSS